MVREFLHALDWEDLRHFAAFAAEQSLSRAAARLGVDHATVGRRIAELEKALGTKLVDRRTRVPGLTPHGAHIAKIVARMQEESFAVARAARGFDAHVAGRVSVSAPPTLANTVIAPALARLRQRHPAIVLELSGEKRAASLSRREADVAVRLSRPAESQLVARKLGVFGFGLYASPTYLEKKRPRDYGFIAGGRDSRDLPQQRWLETQRKERAVVLFADDVESQLAAVRAGLGVAALPHYLARREPALARVKAGSAVTREVWLVVHEDLRGAPAIRAVMDFLAETLGAVLDP